MTSALVSTRVPAAVVAPAPAAPVAVGIERPADAEARERLLDRAFGPARFGKTCERLRVGRLPAAGLSLVARAYGGDHGPGGGADAGCGPLVGTVRLWHVDAGGVSALMLGPLAVDDAWRCHRIGARLMTETLERARAGGHRAVLLVGDAPYYARFGFARRHTLDLRLPGPVEADRFLGLELMPDAFAGAKGVVKPTGAIDLATRRRQHRARVRRAA